MFFFPGNHPTYVSGFQNDLRLTYFIFILLIFSEPAKKKEGWIEYFVDSFQTKEAQNKSLFTSMGAYLQHRKVHVYLSFYINTKNFYTSNKQIIPGWWVLDTLHNINFSLPHHGGHETRIIRQVATKIDPVAPLFAASKRLSILIIISFITASLWPFFWCLSHVRYDMLVSEKKGATRFFVHLPSLKLTVRAWK